MISIRKVTKFTSFINFSCSLAVKMCKLPKRKEKKRNAITFCNMFSFSFANYRERVKAKWSVLIYFYGRLPYSIFSTSWERLEKQNAKKAKIENFAQFPPHGKTPCFFTISCWP